MVKATYDELKWETGQYFSSIREVMIKDTLKESANNFRIRDQQLALKGIFYKDKEIIKNSTYTRFEILPGKFIIGQNDNRPYNLSREEYLKASAKGKFYSLFTISGKNVFPEDFKRIQKFDTAGTSSKNKLQSKYVLFGAENIDKSNSLFVFDMDKQEISEWLIKNARKVKVTGAEIVRLEITDEHYNTLYKIINYNSGKFLLSDDPSSPKTVLKNTDPELRAMGSPNGNYVTDDPGVPPADGKDAYGTVTKGREMPYVQHFQLKQDSLFWNNSSTEKIFISKPEGSALLFSDGSGSYQRLPVIYKQGSQFGILFPDKRSPLVYDSLIYFGNGFIGAKAANGKLNYFFLDQNGDQSGAGPYDSIQTKMKEFQTGDAPVPGAKRAMALKDKRDYNSINNRVKNNYLLEPSEKILIYKSGKVGIRNGSGEIIIPVEYDLIAENGLNFMRPNNSSFIVLKKNGLYGLTEISYNKEHKKYEMSGTIEPVFKQFPAFVARNYYGVKGLRLVGLYDEEFTFFGYGSEKGVLYQPKKK